MGRARAVCIAILLSIAPAASAGQGPAFHKFPPPQILQNYIGPLANNGASQQRAHFGVYGEDEGQFVRVDIRRQSHDGKTNAFQLTLEPSALLKSPPSQPMIIQIDDATQQWSQGFEKADNLPAGAAQKLTIFLAPYKNESEIAPRVAYVSVTPKPVSGGTAGPPGNAPPNAVSNEVAATDVNSVEPNSAGSEGTVSNGASNALSNANSNSAETAAASNKVSAGTKAKGDGPNWEEIAKHWYPLTLVVPLAGLLWWLASGGGHPDPVDADEPVPETPDDEPKAGAGLHAKYSFRLGRGGFSDGEPRLDLPDIRRSFVLRMGESGCPEPLPIVEAVDG